MSSTVRVELNHEGIRALLRSTEALEMVEEFAYDAQGRLGPGYAVSSRVGPGRVNASISAETPAAKKENLENNSILKALR